MKTLIFTGWTSEAVKATFKGVPDAAQFAILEHRIRAATGRGLAGLGYGTVVVKFSKEPRIDGAFQPFEATGAPAFEGDWEPMWWRRVYLYVADEFNSWITHTGGHNPYLDHAEHFAPWLKRAQA